MSFALAFEEQKRVIFALFLREIKTRFGLKRLGYFWALIEPIIHVLIFVLIWKVVGRMGPPGVDPMLFLITGIVPFMMMTNTAGNVMRAIKRNRALLVFPQINVFDFCLARALLEYCTFAIILVLMLYGAYFFGIDFRIENITGVLVAYTALWLFGFGLGMFLLPILAAFPVVDTVYKLVMRVMYFTSGVIISIQRIPYEYQHYLKWNPLFQLIEMFRGEFFYAMEAHPQHVDIHYVLGIGLLVWLGGLVLQKRMMLQILKA